MKKFLLLLIAVAFIFGFNNLQAQTKFSFGARGGTNFSNLSFNPDISSRVTKSSTTGILFGGVAEINFIPMLSLQIEPTFLTGGSSLSGPLFSNGIQTVNGKITYSISYLELPFLLKFNVPISKSDVVPYAFVGPNLGFILSSKEKDEPDGYSSGEADMKDQTSSINFALDFGIGVGYKVAPKTMVTFDVRYSLGLTNLLNDKGKQGFTGDQSIKVNGFQFAAGAMFGL